MIVVFGSSTDVGRRLISRLVADGAEVRGVSRRGAHVADLETGQGVREAMTGARLVVSCAHARFTRVILGERPTGSGVVLMGSAWRYSAVPNRSADQVREAERDFLASGADGVMLHPAMIYGGMQENNIRRLIGVLRRFPFVVAPGGGRQRVQPIYVEDVARCLHAATSKTWQGAHVIGLGGEPMTWRAMVEAVAEAIGVRRRIISLPLGPCIAAAAALNSLGIRAVDAGVFRRFAEDVKIAEADMVDQLGVTPIAFRDGIRIAVSEWREAGAI